METRVADHSLWLEHENRFSKRLTIGGVKYWMGDKFRQTRLKEGGFLELSICGRVFLLDELFTVCSNASWQVPATL